MRDEDGAGQAGDGAASEPLAPYTVIQDRFELRETIGSGGMGEVRRAYDRRLDRFVAMKGLLGHTGRSADTQQAARDRARREAKALAKVEHQNVVTVHDQVETDDQVWIVMKLLEGRSLADLLRHERVLGVPRAADIGLQILHGLQAVHRAGVVHRDVKPGNVLVRDGGRAILVDFGIASIAGANKLTKLGVPIGTPPYMAPELFAPASPGPKSASDLWALGVTLYEMAEGRLPFRGHEVWEIQENIRSTPEPPYRYSGPLAPVIQGLLDPDKDRRLDAGTAEAMLREVLRDPDLPAAPLPEQPTQAAAPDFTPDPEPAAPVPVAAPEEPSVAREEKQGGGRRGWKTGLAVVLAAVLAGGGWYFSRDGEPSGSSGSGSEPAATAAEKRWEKWRSANEVLRVGVKKDQPQLSEEKDGEYQGFDISMALAIAKALGYEKGDVLFVPVNTENRSTMLDNKRAHLIVASYSITDEREKEVDFVGPYFRAGRTFLVREKSTQYDLRSAADIKQKDVRVCTAAHSTYERHLKEGGYKAYAPQPASYETCVDKLLDETADVYAVASDDVLLAGLAYEKRGQVRLLDSGAGTEEYGVAMRPEDQPLKGKVCTALRQIITGGEWDRMYKDHLAVLNLPPWDAPDPPKCGA
ncbi:serine/threonine-protein kinase [Streptomyces albidoflavus]|uniref:serine/threonine-protein kinase n=1 Tax=Streptomyces albidoflavus TaxID=1886 RepID=UPI00387305F5|nr:serine/threonine-protein kinase [Streptomyces albidoflavus]